MKNKRLVIRVIVLGVIFLALGSALYTAFQSDDAPVQLNTMAPNFQLETLEGETVHLSDFRGKGVFINFWGSWCEPCKKEMPYIEAEYQEMKEKGIEILAVNITESNVAINAFKNRFELSFPILLDRDRTVTQRYGVLAIPSSFFINEHGVVVAKVEGEMTAQQIRQYLEQIKTQQ